MKEMVDRQCSGGTVDNADWTVRPINHRLWHRDARGCRGAGAELPGQAHPHHRPGRARRADRHPGPARVADLAEARATAVVENRAGAGGAIGARALATAAPDGYTLLAGNTSVLAVIPAVSASAGYDPTKDFAAVAKVSESYQILVVHPSLAVEDACGELVDLCQGQSRQAQLRAHRPRRTAAPHRRIVQGARRRRHRRRALQERRRVRHRRTRRTGRR